MTLTESAQQSAAPQKYAAHTERVYARKVAESPDTTNAPPVIGEHRKERSAASDTSPPHNHEPPAEDLARVYAGRPSFPLSQCCYCLQRLCRGMSISHWATSPGRSSPIQQLCNRSYGNLTYVGAHNSYAVGVNNRKFCIAIHLLSIVDYIV